MPITPLNTGFANQSIDVVSQRVFVEFYKRSASSGSKTSGSEMNEIALSKNS
jgi:hypothetical protein